MNQGMCAKFQDVVLYLVFCDDTFMVFFVVDISVP